MTEFFVVRSGQGDYPVHMTDRLQESVEVLMRAAPTAVVIDRRVAGLYRDALAPLLSRNPVLEREATEEVKTLDGVGDVLRYLQERNCTRESVFLAIGGGIIQDLATFSAHVYYRGIRWILLPTTLLSMADSCIGAKCGINLNQFKNQLGVFHSPSEVFICPEFLGTLSDRDMQSGFGEILKLALTGSREFFLELIEELDREGFRTPRVGAFIHQSLMVKKAVIEEDEYELDLRRILNYGHTFGHVLESLTDYEIPHGCAVAWGADLANWVAVRHGILAESDFRAIHDAVKRHFSFRVSRPVPVPELLSGIRRDKKMSGGRINLVLLDTPGKLIIRPTDVDEVLEAQVREYLEHDSVVRWD